MASKKLPNLAAGLSKNSASLLNDASISMANRVETITWIPRENVIDNPFEDAVYAKRAKEIESAALDALARDIAARGIQSPIKVVSDDGIRYRTISGHRRRWANDIAVEKYGYADGAKLPCIVKEKYLPSEQTKEREDLILDNLQRDKTPYERMLEIIEIKKISQELKDSGRYDGNVRDRVMAKLGVNNTEITRNEKIYGSLIPALMHDFEEGNLSFTLAYDIARALEESMQEAFSNAWKRDGLPLSRAQYNEIMSHIATRRQDTAESLDIAEPQQGSSQPEEAAEYVAGSSDENSAENIPGKPQAPAQPKEQKIEVYVINNFEEGAEKIASTYATIGAGLSKMTFEYKTKRKLMARLQKMYAAAMSFKAELAGMGIPFDDDGVK